MRRNPFKGLVLPDILNIGLAKPHPVDGTRFAQRVRLAPPTAWGVLQNGWTATNGLVLSSFYIPAVGYQGPVTILPYQPGQLPNPYQTASSS